VPAVHGAGRGQAYVGGLPRNGGKDRIAPERVRAVGAVGADLVFQRLGVRVEQVLYDNATALQKLKNGELAALVRVIGRPIDFFAKIAVIRACTSCRYPFQIRSPTTTRLAS